MFGTQSHYLPYLFVWQVLQPQQHDGSVEQVEPMDTLIQHLHLSALAVLPVKEPAVDRQLHPDISCPLLLAVGRDAGVHAHAVNPRLGLTLITKLGKSFPQVNQYLLKQVCHLVRVVREEVAHAVDTALVLPNKLLESRF